LQEIEKQIKEQLSSNDDEDGPVSSNASALSGATVCGINVTKGSRTLLFDASGSAWPLAELNELSGGRSDVGAEVAGGRCCAKWHSGVDEAIGASWFPARVKRGAPL